MVGGWEGRNQRGFEQNMDYKVLFRAKYVVCYFERTKHAFRQILSSGESGSVHPFNITFFRVSKYWLIEFFI